MLDAKKVYKKIGFNSVFFTDRKRCDNLITIIKKLPKNSAVIFREYDLEEEKREKLAREILLICKQKSHKIIIGKNLDLATEIKADGVHFSDNDILSSKIFLQLRNNKKINSKNGTKFIFSFACHNFLSVVKCQKMPVDLIFISPIFATKSHEDLPTFGLQRLSRVLRFSKKPVFALGGINKKNIHIVKKLGASGFGGIETFKY